MAKDRHIIGVEYTITDTEAKTTADNHREVVPNPSNRREGIVNAKPMAPVYTRPRTFRWIHLSDKIPPAITPIKEEIAIVNVDNGPASDISNERFSANRVGSQFFVAQPGKLGVAK